MSWPAAGGPRFVFASDPRHAPLLDGEAGARAASGYVYDRARCHAIVAEFTATMEMFARSMAREHAERLNAA